MATVDDMVNAYVVLRDKKKQMQDKHKEELAPINKKLDTLEMGMLAHLNHEHAESVRTCHGTVYRIKRTSTKVDDWDAALEYILTNHLEHMLERRVSKSAIEEFLEANGELPPGISLSADLTVGVRRK
jgi:chromosome segregation ATPase